MDNFFTSHSLLQELKHLGFRATGTVREARLKKCPLEDTKLLSKKDRGEFDLRCDGEVLAVKWNDNKCVCLATNYDTVHPMVSTTRYSRTQRKRVQVQQPKLIQQYNKHMGGVDLLDRFISDYRPTLRSKKWYWPLLSNLLVTLRVAAWRLHVDLQNEPQHDQLQFVRLIEQGLFGEVAPEREVPGPSRALHFWITNGSGHHMVPSGKQRRCRLSKKNSRMMCKKCEVPLHIHCAEQFHK
ncbi:hypothetical protein HPB47_012866 [Ixodes persulcatus]|uniref:Uncharacterized protein n=1 Tax=Ixodes persulcatus TaxID=34615 RepID=A0AC60NSJ6_IXOPE|nr:hypothetical protein HPB47_012866 [Ixodes persulcatus]